MGRLRAIAGNVLLFLHGHLLSVFAACWLGLEPKDGHCFFLGTAMFSIVGYQHDRNDPVIRLWNDCSREKVARRSRP